MTNLPELNLFQGESVRLISQCSHQSACVESCAREKVVLSLYEEAHRHEYGFTPGHDGLWYELNDAQTGYVIEPRATFKAKPHTDEQNETLEWMLNHLRGPEVLGHDRFTYRVRQVQFLKLEVLLWGEDRVADSKVIQALSDLAWAHCIVLYQPGSPLSFGFDLDCLTTARLMKRDTERALGYGPDGLTAVEDDACGDPTMASGQRVRVDGKDDHRGV